MFEHLSFEFDHSDLAETGCRDYRTWPDSTKWLYRTSFFRVCCTSFHNHSPLYTFFLCLIVLFQSCCSHAQVFGKTLLHEIPIFYRHTEWNLLFSGTNTLLWWRACYQTTKLQTNNSHLAWPRTLCCVVRFVVVLKPHGARSDPGLANLVIERCSLITLSVDARINTNLQRTIPIWQWQADSSYFLFLPLRVVSFICWRQILPVLAVHKHQIARPYWYY